MITCVDSWTLSHTSLSCYHLVTMAQILVKGFLDSVALNPQPDSFLQMNKQNPAAVSFAPRVRNAMQVPLMESLKKLAGLEALWCIFVEGGSCLGTEESENLQSDGEDRGVGWGGEEDGQGRREKERTKPIRGLLNHPIVGP